MTYRNPILLGLAAVAPHCMEPSCRAANHGQIVAAHSNQGRDGKGTGIKASDAAVAFLCDRCHHFVDQGKAAIEARLELWETAHRATMRWLIEAGYLAAFLTPQDPPPPKPKRKAKISSGRKIESRGFEPRLTPQKIPSRPFQKRSDR